MWTHAGNIKRPHKKRSTNKQNPNKREMRDTKRTEYKNSEVAKAFCHCFHLCIIQHTHNTFRILYCCRSMSVNFNSNHSEIISRMPPESQFNDPPHIPHSEFRTSWWECEITPSDRIAGDPFWGSRITLTPRQAYAPLRLLSHLGTVVLLRQQVGQFLRHGYGFKDNGGSSIRTVAHWTLRFSSSFVDFPRFRGEFLYRFLNSLAHAQLRKRRWDGEREREWANTFGSRRRCLLSLFDFKTTVDLPMPIANSLDSTDPRTPPAKLQMTNYSRRL